MQFIGDNLVLILVIGALFLIAAGLYILAQRKASPNVSSSGAKSRSNARGYRQGEDVRQTPVQPVTSDLGRLQESLQVIEERAESINFALKELIDLQRAILDQGRQVNALFLETSQSMSHSYTNSNTTLDKILRNLLSIQDRLASFEPDRESKPIQISLVDVQPEPTQSPAAPANQILQVGGTVTSVPNKPAFDSLIASKSALIAAESRNGSDGLRIMESELSRQLPVSIERPCQEVFVVSVDLAGDRSGKAFVVPGSYPGRPWQDWFELPRGAFERVEETISPAELKRIAGGPWQLVNKGRVQQ